MARRVRVGRLENIAGGGVDHDGTVAVRPDLRPGLRGKHGGKGEGDTGQSGQTQHDLASSAFRPGHSLLPSGGSREL